MVMMKTDSGTGREKRKISVGLFEPAPRCYQRKGNTIYVQIRQLNEYGAVYARAVSDISFICLGLTEFPTETPAVFNVIEVDNRYGTPYIRKDYKHFLKMLERENNAEFVNDGRLEKDALSLTWMIRNFAKRFNILKSEPDNQHFFNFVEEISK